jgi:hypothetical protein
MVKVKYDSSKKQWIELEKRSKDPESIYLDRKLKNKLDNIINLRKKGWDSIFIIDGDRRAGKSTVAKSCGYYLDPNISIKNFVSGMGDALDKIESLPDESVVIFDEASLTFSSKDHANKGQKQLLKVIDVIGVKKMTMILVLPTFFELTKPLAIFHSRFLLHVYTDKNLIRGRIAYFGTKNKKLLYEMGKKNYNSYGRPSADFVGKFVNYIPYYENEYLALKKKSRDESFNKRSVDSIDKKDYTTIIKKMVENNMGSTKPLPFTTLSTLTNVARSTLSDYKQEILQKHPNSTSEI